MAEDAQNYAVRQSLPPEFVERIDRDPQARKLFLQAVAEMFAAYNETRTQQSLYGRRLGAAIDGVVRAVQATGIAFNPNQEKREEIASKFTRYMKVMQAMKKMPIKPASRRLPPHGRH